MSRKRRSVADEPFFVVRSLAADHAAGDRIGQHKHEWHQLVYVSRGVISVQAGSDSWTVPPTWAVWVAAGVSHRIRFVLGSSLRTLYFRPGPDETTFARCRALTVSPLLREMIACAITEGMLDERSTPELALATLLKHEIQRSVAPPFTLPQPMSPATRRVAALIEAGAGTPASTVQLADAAGAGVRTLERRFLRETGMTLGRWRQHHGMLASLEQLARGAQVKAVAASAGYATPSAFVAAFRHAFGVTPGRYLER